MNIQALLIAVIAIGGTGIGAYLWACWLNHKQSSSDS